jgi:glutathione S-transferase
LYQKPVSFTLTDEELEMADLTLIIGNKNYSSWSFRPWILLKEADIPFTEKLVWIRESDSAKNIAKYNPAGRVPALLDGKITVWESLAICEYLAEKFPDKKLWPANAAARAMARSVSNEMHAGFQALRKTMPFNCRASIPLAETPAEAREDVARVTDIWTDCRKYYGGKGKFLFGDFTIADAMYAPVCLRFETYGIKLDPVSKAYANAVLSLASTQEWIAAAKKEPKRIEESEIKPGRK